MVNIQKVGIIILVTLFSSAAIFYFWGGAGQLEESEFSYIDTNTGPQVKELDSLKELTVMTYNIGYLSGMTNNKAVPRGPEFYSEQEQNANVLITDLDIDIIGYQEIDFGSERSLGVDQLSQLSKAIYPYLAIAVNWDKNYVPFPYWPPSAHFGSMLSGQAIASKFEISSTDRVILPKPASNSILYNRFYLDRIIQVSTLKIGGKDVKVLNVHLEAFDVATRQEHAKIVMRLYTDLSANYPVILMGDFNSVPPFASDLEAIDNAMYTFYNTEGLVPAISERDYKSDEQSNLTYDSENPIQKLDYIFVTSRDFEVIEASVVQEAETISDHLPVMTRLRVKW